MRDRRLNTETAGDDSGIGAEVSCLSTRQRAILQFIDDYRRDHPYAPTLREIARGVGLRSSSTVNVHIQYLVQRGCLRKGKRTSRTLVLLEAGYRQLDWSSKDCVESECSLEVMAVDPDIQQELIAIQMEFATTEGNGLAACEAAGQTAPPE